MKIDYGTLTVLPIPLSTTRNGISPWEKEMDDSLLQVQVKVPSGRTLYYYYPVNNVYFNPATKEYWYYDSGTITWVRVSGLPAIMHLQRTPQYEIYYDGGGCMEGQ